MPEQRPICPWGFLNLGDAELPRSYASVVAKPVVPISILPPPVVQDGKTTVTISEEGYQSGLEKCKHMLLGRIHLAHGDKPYSPSELQKELGLVWGEIGHWNLIPMGRGYFTFSFASEAALSMVWSKGSITLKPGMLRFMRWVPNFSPANQRNTNAQVWVRFWDLGLEFWEPITLFEIANGIGVPVKIDSNTLGRRFGLFARILVDIDLSTDPPLELVVRRKNGETLIVEVEYERLPSLCSHCGNVGHNVASCKLVRRSEQAKSASVNDTDVVRGRSRKPRLRRHLVK